MVGTEQLDMMEMCLSHNRLRRVAASKLGRAPASPVLDPEHPPEIKEILRHIKQVAAELENAGVDYAAKG